MFHWAQLDVLLVAERAGPVTSNRGLALHVDKAFSNAPTGDVLRTPGGEHAVLSRLMRDPSRAYLNFLIARSKTARYVASV